MNFEEVFLLFVFVFTITGFIYENLFKEWLILLYLYYPLISVCQGLIPHIIMRVRPGLLPTHRADFCLNITDINYILDSHLNEIYLTLGWCSICLSTILSLSEIIPLFLRPIIYNTKKYLTKKYYKYSFIYYKELY